MRFGASLNLKRMQCLIVATCLAIPAVGWARSTVRVSHARSDVWAATVRLLRVNNNFPIREKDESAGYVLFDFVEAGKSYRGSFEFVATIDASGTPLTEVIVTIADLPRRFETQLLDRLTQKVREERGAPAPKPPRVLPSASRDTEGDKESGASKGGPDAGLPSLPRLESRP